MDKNMIRIKLLKSVLKYCEIKYIRTKLPKHKSSIKTKNDNVFRQCD